MRDLELLLSYIQVSIVFVCCGCVLCQHGVPSLSVYYMYSPICLFSLCYYYKLDSDRLTNS